MINGLYIIFFNFNFNFNENVQKHRIHLHNSNVPEELQHLPLQYLDLRNIPWTIFIFWPFWGKEVSERWEFCLIGSSLLSNTFSLLFFDLITIISFVVPQLFRSFWLNLEIQNTIMPWNVWKKTWYLKMMMLNVH